MGNLLMLCSFHHRLLHEGGYRIRRDCHGEHYFVQADGRAIPRCGYREDDYVDDDESDSPSMEGSLSAGRRGNHSGEVRESRGIYRVAQCSV